MYSGKNVKADGHENAETVLPGDTQKSNKDISGAETEKDLQKKDQGEAVQNDDDVLYDGDIIELDDKEKKKRRKKSGNNASIESNRSSNTVKITINLDFSGIKEKASKAKDFIIENFTPEEKDYPYTETERHISTASKDDEPERQIKNIEEFPSFSQDMDFLTPSSIKKSSWDDAASSASPVVVEKPESREYKGIRIENTYPDKKPESKAGSGARNSTGDENRVIPDGDGHDDPIQHESSRLYEQADKIYETGNTETYELPSDMNAAPAVNIYDDQEPPADISADPAVNIYDELEQPVSDPAVNMKGQSPEVSAESEENRYETLTEGPSKSEENEYDKPDATTSQSYENVYDPSAASVKSENGERIRTAVVLLICAAVAVAAAWAVNYFVIGFTHIDGQSMYPTFNDNDFIIVNKMTYRFSKPERYDVIIFRTHNSEGKSEYCIKRVIGLPGETVRILEGKIYITDKNGEEKALDDEEYTLSDHIDDPGIAEVPQKLGNNTYFVLGDNRNASSDSRSSYIGLIDKRDIVGKAVFCLWPPRDFGSYDLKK